MKKGLFAAAIMLFAVPVFAQKNEVSFSAIYVRENPSFTQKDFKYNKSTDQIGGAFSFTRFGSGSVGVNAEIADSAKGGSSTDANLLTGMVGVTIKSRNSRIQPFFKGDVGVARLAARNALLKFDKSDAGFAFSAGAGVDFRLSKSVAVRVLEVDYLGTRILGQNVPHVRASSGLVFKF